MPVIDEDLGPKFQGVDDPLMDSAGEKIVFRTYKSARRGRENWALYTNGQLGKNKAWLGPVGIAPDGTLAYWESRKRGQPRNGMREQQPAFLHFGDRETKAFDPEEALPFSTPEFAPALNAFVCVVETNHGCGLMVAPLGKEPYVIGDESAGVSLDLIRDYAVSPDGERIAYSEREMPLLPPGVDPAPGEVVEGFVEPPPLLKEDGKVYGAEFNGVGRPVFSPDNNILALKFLDGERMGVTTTADQVPTAEWDFVSTPVFSPNSERMAFAAYDISVGNPRFFALCSFAESLLQPIGRCRLVLRSTDGTPEVQDGEFRQIAHLTFSPDSNEVAFAGLSNGKWQVRFGDVRSDPFDFIGPIHFDEDSNAVEFGARREREVLWVRLEK